MRKSKEGTTYIYDGKNVLAEIEDDIVRLNVYGNALLMTVEGAITTTDGVITVSGKIAYAYEMNLHGDVVKVMSMAGLVFNSYKYDAFGVIVEKSELVANTFYYSGYQYDTETGMYYLRSRYYDPETARFLTEDAFAGYYSDPLSLNKYTYCHNNPISYHDPDGFASKGWWGWLVVAVIVTALVVATIATGGAAVGMAAIGMAAAGTTAAGAGIATTVLAFATVGAGLAFVGTAAVAGVDAIDTYSRTGDLGQALDRFGDYGPAAAVSTTIGGVVGGALGYVTYKLQHPKTPTPTVDDNPSDDVKPTTTKNKTVVEGKPHGSPEHQERINDQLDDMVESGSYDKIYANKSLKTAGLTGNERPDITGIKNDGTAEIWEFASKSQAKDPGFTELINKIDKVVKANPGLVSHFIPWEE